MNVTRVHTLYNLLLLNYCYPWQCNSKPYLYQNDFLAGNSAVDLGARGHVMVHAEYGGQHVGLGV